MLITKYPQSCLLLEKAGQRIAIDPGNYFANRYSISELGNLAGVLYTHRHADHFDAVLAAQLAKANFPLYGNSDVAALIGPGAIMVAGGQRFSLGGFDILAVDIAHFSKPGVSMPPNTGYIIDGQLFHPGDGVKNNGQAAAVLAAPIGTAAGFEAIIEFINSVGAKRVVPIHYSNQASYPCDPQDFAALVQATVRVDILEDGKSIDLTL